MMRFALFFAIGMAAAGCGGAAKTGSAAEIRKANAFFERVFEERVAMSPLFQAHLGRKTNNDKWDDISEEQALREHGRNLRHLKELHSEIEPARLDESGRLSVELLKRDLEQRIEGHRWRFHTYPLNQMRGLHSSVPAFLINYHRVDSTADARAYIRRIRAVKPLFDQLVKAIRTRESKGVVAPRFAFPYVISDCRNILQGRPFTDGTGASTILADFEKKVKALGERDALITEAKAALLEDLAPAYRKLIRTAESVHAKATTDDGVWKLPDGAGFYGYRLRRMTTTDMTADEIHDLGLREVARIQDEMRAIKEKVGFKGELKQFFEFMRTDKRFFHEETDEGRERYLKRAAEIIASMKLRLDELFGVKPKADIVVKRVEPFREKSAGKAFYQSPAPDGSRPGIYYANLHRMSHMPLYQMEALAYHEGIPGHHMQLAIAVELEDVPQFRKYLGSTAYTEGWGLYSELIPKEMGFYRDPYSDFGRLAMEIWRACRLVVDTGIHHKKWTRERAIEYLMENTPNPRGDALKAVERYIVMPGQATAYKIGMIKILELREHARRELGDAFDIRGFHDVVLKNGPVPLGVLEDLVNEWIAIRKSGL